MKTISQNDLLRRLPSVDELLRERKIAALAERAGHTAATAAIRKTLADLRKKISANHWHEAEVLAELAQLPMRIERELNQSLAPSLQPVINATGVVLHTNLGRAPLAAAALQKIQELGAGYSNLEFDLASGRRGKRDSHADRLFSVFFTQQLGTRAAEKLSTIVVNNNAAAVLLALNTLAEGGEAIVSRGELVEIGGSFRIPEVMAKAGVGLREVGTTNRTRLSDYQRAIHRNTRALLRVHRSNFQITGFTEQPTLAELAKLASKHRVPLIEDLGSGALFDLRSLGIMTAQEEEASVVASLKSGVSVVTYSGDKLLGGPQAGILTGEKKLIARIRQNPLFRALRVDKLTYAALEATLAAAIRQDVDSIPALHMMRTGADEIGARAEAIARRLVGLNGLQLELKRGASMVGGGAAPGAKLRTFLLAARWSEHSAEELARALRTCSPAPIIARVERDRVLLDLRTVFPEQDSYLSTKLKEITQA